MKSLILVLLISTYAFNVFAHQTSDSFLNINEDGSDYTAEWRIPLDTLDTLFGAALNIDLNQDKKITWGELKIKQDEIASFAFSKLKITHLDQTCDTLHGDFKLDKLNTGLYLFLPFSISCAWAESADRTINMEYQLFFEQDAYHRGFVSFSGPYGSSKHIFSPDVPSIHLSKSATGQLYTFVQFVKEGIWHIWIGLDHILFLLSLLLPAVFFIKQRQREIHQQFTPMVKDVLKVVSSFTLAHSITLTLATMNILLLPAMLVESVIAISVVIGSLAMLSPRLHAYRWQFAFGFGLIHGFGFANVLQDLNLSQGEFVSNLLAFNLGVEFGQLAIVAAILPSIYFLRTYKSYKRLFLPASASSMAIVGAVWFVERALIA